MSWCLYVLPKASAWVAPQYRLSMASVYTVHEQSQAAFALTQLHLDSDALDMPSSLHEMLTDVPVCRCQHGNRAKQH